MSHSDHIDVLLEKWTCEKCRQYAFEDYDEACAHELTCDGPVNTRLPSTNKSTNESPSHNPDSSKPKKPNLYSQMQLSIETFNCRGKTQQKKTVQRKQKQSDVRVLPKTNSLSEKQPINDGARSQVLGNENVPLASIFLKNSRQTSLNNNGNKKDKQDIPLTKTASVKGRRADEAQNFNHDELKGDTSRLACTSKRRKLTTNESDSAVALIDLTAEYGDKAFARLVKAEPVISEDDIVTIIELYHTIFPKTSHVWTHETTVGKTKQLVSTRRQFPRLDSATLVIENTYHETPLNIYLNSSSDKFFRNSDRIYEVLSSIFDRPQFVNLTSDTLCWSEKHKIQNIPNDICGSHNVETSEKMVDFIENWRSHRQSAIDTRNEKVREMLGIKKKKAHSKKKLNYMSDDGDDDFLSDDEVGGLPSVLLLTGPTGSGKTSLVHAVASKCQCVVIEVNTTMKRSGQAVKNIIEESTQSHSNLALLRGGISQDVDEILMEEDDSLRDNVASLSLVLIDEVDLVFENDGDAGFWLNLASLTKRAKSPIILTASYIPQPLLNSKSVKFVHLTTERPTPIECASKICQIAKNEGMVWVKDTAQSACVKDRLMEFARLCRGDIRKILNEMQLFEIALKSSSEIKDTNQRPVVRGLDEQKSTSSTFRTMAYPTISCVSPRILSSDTEATITLKGKNFLSIMRPDYVIQISVGDQLCSQVLIVDNETVTATVPKPRFARTHYIEYVKSNRYLPILFCVTNGKGEIVVSSDASMCRLNDDGFYSSIPNVEYIFPESSYFIQAGSRADFDNTSSDCCDRVGLKVLVNESLCVSDSKMIDESDTNEDGSAETAADVSYSNASDEAVAIVTPLSQDSIKFMGESTVDNYLQQCILESDVSFLADSLNMSGFPCLSGAVEGLSPNDCTDKVLGKSSSRNNDFNIFSGANETYMTRPTSGRDRYLLITSSTYSRGLASLPSQTLSIPAFHPKDTEHDTVTQIQNQQIQTADEDLFLPCPVAPSLFLLPDILKDIGYNILSSPVNVECFDITLEYNRNQRTERLLQMFGIIFEESFFSLDLNSSWLKEQLFLDYIPCLRNMAYFERRKECNQNQACIHHRTRRAVARAHYFDAQLKCSLGALIGNEMEELRLGFKNGLLFN